MQRKYISVAVFDSWIQSVLHSVGYGASDARIIADVLVHAHCRGIESHGIIRLPEYIKRIRAGLVDPHVRPVLHYNTARTIVHVDARGGSGQIAAHETVEAMLTCVEQQGNAMAVVKGSTHFGPAGYFARLCAARECVALVLSNAEPCVAPYGGTHARLGTNPLSFAAPHKDYPIIVDMATSLSSMGKVFVAQEKNTNIPQEWAFDTHGNPTDNPHEVASLRSFGGYKGFALSLVIEILSGVLSGAGYGAHVGNMYKEYDHPQNVGHFMWCAKIDALMDIEHYYARIADLLSMTCNTPLAPGHESIRIPGHIADQREKERRAHGLPCDDALLHEITKVEAVSGIQLIRNIS